MFFSCMKNYTLHSKIKRDWWNTKRTKNQKHSEHTHVDYYMASLTLQISFIFNVMNNSAK